MGLVAMVMFNCLRLASVTKFYMVYFVETCLKVSLELAIRLLVCKARDEEY